MNDITITFVVLALVVALFVVWVGVSMLEWLLSRTAEPAPEEPEVPRALPGIEGPVTVRPASIDTPVEPPVVQG